MCHMLTIRFFCHSSLIPDSLARSRPAYDSKVELGWVMCRGLKKSQDFGTMKYAAGED